MQLFNSAEQSNLDTETDTVKRVHRMQKQNYTDGSKSKANRNKWDGEKQQSKRKQPLT